MGWTSFENGDCLALTANRNVTIDAHFHAQRHLTYDLFGELAETMENNDYCLTPNEVWRCRSCLRADHVKTLEPGDA